MANTYQNTTTEQLIQSLLTTNPDKAGQIFTGQNGVGSQFQEDAYNVLTASVLPAWQQQYQAEITRLKSINPAFDPAKYLADLSQVVSSGEGASSNRDTPIKNAAYQMQSQKLALQRAQQAATTYQQTGQISAYPTVQELAKDTYSKITGYQLDPRAEANVVNRLQGNISEEDKSTANAAAARVGAPLPYPTSTIGQIGAGGVFQTPEQAQQAYSNGQLNQIGQNIVNSNSAANMKNGVNQVTNNADGTFSWNGQNYANKDAAIQAAQQVGVTSLRFSDGTTTGGAGTTGASGTTGTSGTAGTTGSTTGGASVNNATTQFNKQAALDVLKNAGLDSGTLALFQDVVNNWDPNSEINIPNILNKFQEIKTNTIDPYFAEQSKIFEDQIKNSEVYQRENRAMELEQEKTNANQNIQNAQNSLEARGMTFTGEAVDQLGGTSAYGGNQQNWQLGNTPEGKVNQANRLMSSSSQSRYMQGLQQLQRQAETTLGSIKSQGMIPEVQQLGNISGSMEQDKNTAASSTLNNLYNQEQTNYQQNKQLNVFN